MVSDSWHSYPSIYALGHRAVADLLTGPVNVEEKVDGSQFSWCVDDAGEIRCRSKCATLNVDAPEKMFTAAVATVKSLAGLLTPGWTYRAEFLGKPKHNALAYDRMPKAHLIVFDINDGHESYLSYAAKHEEAERLGLECVPLIFSGRLTLADFLRERCGIRTRADEHSFQFLFAAHPQEHDPPPQKDERRRNSEVDEEDSLRREA